MADVNRQYEELPLVSDDLEVRSLVLPSLPSPELCVRCGSGRTVDYGARWSCGECGATWQGR